MLAILALCALVVWLHSARPSRRIVPSLQIWLTLPDLAGVSQCRRLLPRPSWLLLLQLAALLILVLALARPYFGEQPSQHLIVVLDASGEMNAASDDGPVFAAARQQVAEALESRKHAPPDSVSLIVAAPLPRLVAARHPYEPRMAATLLTDVEASDGPADWVGTLELINQTRKAGETVDGLFVGAAMPAALEAMATDLRHLTLLKTVMPNLAPRLDLRLVGETNGKWLVTGVVTSAAQSSAAILEVGFTAVADIGKRPPLPWKTSRIKLTEGRADINEALVLKEAGLLTLTVTAEGTTHWPGAQAQFLTGPKPTQKVLYLTDNVADELSLVRAIMAQEGLELFRAAALPANADDFALVIVDGVTLAQPPKAHTVWIANRTADTAMVHDADYWHPHHPLTQTADWQVPDFGTVSTKPLPEDAEILLAGNGVPLLALSRHDTWQDIHVQFDPNTMNWRSSEALPVFAGALTDWLSLTGTKRANCQVGLPCGASPGTYSAIAGDHRFTNENAVFTPTHSGTFLAETGQVLAINPAPQRHLDAAEVDAADADQPGSEAVSPVPFLLIAAIALLIADAALRYRKSGKRTLPAFLAPALLSAALLGLAFPLPFARTIEVQLLPQGGVAQRAGPQVVAGPTPRLDSSAAGTEPAADRITHIREALTLASALVPPHQVANIVAASPIRGPISTLAPVQLARHAALNVAPPPSQPFEAPILTALAMPAHATIGDRLSLTALVQSAQATPLELAFYANGRQLGDHATPIERGMNRIETELPPLAAGETLITVTASTPAGRVSSLSAIVSARAGRPVMVLAPQAEHGAAFARMAGADSELVVIDPANAPDYLRNYLGYDAVVLLNMPARAVTSREAGLIETAVTQHGVGLLALGGNNAFGPGGYYATPFERLSPLSARVPREAPEVTMVFVLDRSGSMNQDVAGGTRLEMARQATSGAVELLNPASQVGIVVFDSEARIVLPLTPASDTEAVRSALASVDTGGGTAIAPGLEAGWSLLKNSEAQARHMIVMTDGLSLPGDFSGIAGQMRDEGITVSAVAVGTEADARAVLEIAAAGGGSVHASSDFASLPSILSQEAMLLSSPVREGREQPRLRDRSDPLLHGLSDAVPPINGVVLTTEKPEARVALTTTNAQGEEAPLLATWRQGNGQVLAFASDVTGNWTREWQSAAALAEFWPHVLRQVRPVRPANGPWLTLTHQGETMLVSLEALDDEAELRSGLAPRARISFETGETLLLPLMETSPGMYEAQFAPTQTGRISAQLSLPAPVRPPTNRAREEIVEAAYYLNRPYWAEPYPSVAPRLTGGVTSVPEGWSVRLVAGLTTPWLILALVSFIITLILYMRPPRLVSRRAPKDAATRSTQGLAS